MTTKNKKLSKSGEVMSRYKENYTLFKRGKYWYYRTYDERGVRTTAKTTGQTSKTLAKEFCEQLYLSGGLNVTCQTFGQFASHFYDDGSPFLTDRTKPLSKNTLTSYRGSMTNYIMPTFKDVKLSDISYMKLKLFRSELLQTLSTSSIKLILAAMENVLKSAYRNGMISKNPFDLLENISSNKKKRGCFTRDELKKVVHSLPDEDKKLTVALALTGMRLSEGFYITSDDIRTVNGLTFIHLYRQMQKGEWCELKNKKDRDIPIIHELKNFFEFKEQTLKTFRTHFNEAVESCGLSDSLTPHSLRHFFISDAKASNINPLKVETIAGHSLKGIEDTYTTFTVENLSDILEWQKEVFDFLTK